MSVESVPPPVRLTDHGLESYHTSLVMRTKWRIAVNAIRNLRKHVYLHATVGTGLAVLLLGGGTGMFSWIFRYLTRQPVWGAPLMDRLVGIVILIFFSMLLFSNLIITLSTTYISKEVEFLMGLPMSRQSIFRQKLIETILFSSWAFALLSLPLFLSYGYARSVDVYLLPLVMALVVPFLVIPATLGAILTMVLAAVFPARKTRTLCVVLGVLGLFGTLVLGRSTGLGRMLATADNRDFLQIMDALSIGNSPLFPSAWLSSALQAIAPPDRLDRDMGAFFYWFGMLIVTALFLLEVTRWLVPHLYYKGWCLSRDAAVKEVESHAKFSPFRAIDKALGRIFPSATAGLLSKDLKTFWRDPSQWTQLVILFGLMIVYITNVSYTRQYNRTIELVVRDFKTMLGYFNMTATCFILSILTTRFVYPMLSLEGRGFWTVGLAPINRTRVVWQKYILCLALCICVAVPLTILSNHILEVDASFMRISLAMAVAISAGLTSLSVGIGAILPDFKEDNPARIANGIGGTMNVLTSLAYVAISVILLAVPMETLPKIAGKGHLLSEYGLMAMAFLGLLLQLVVIVLPISFGLRRWRNLEF